MAGTDKNVRFTFCKEERLKSKKLIDELFSDKTFVQNSVLRIYFKQVTLDCAFRAQFAFAVPKKIFQHATDRNRIKRLMRESVRLQKHLFSESLQKNDKQIILLLSYHARSIYTFSEIDDAITKLLQKLTIELD